MFLDDIVGPMSVAEAKKSVKENAWSDGQSQWSSEHDQWAKEDRDVIPALTGVGEGATVAYVVTYFDTKTGDKGESTVSALTQQDAKDQIVDLMHERGYDVVVTGVRSAQGVAEDWKGPAAALATVGALATGVAMNPDMDFDGQRYEKTTQHALSNAPADAKTVTKDGKTYKVWTVPAGKHGHDRKGVYAEINEADETSWTANSAQFRKEEDMSWTVEVTLEPQADINQGRGRQVKTITVTAQSRDAAKKKLVDYYRKNGWAVTGIKFTGDLDEGSFAHDQLKGEITDLFKPVVLQIVKWARAEGMTAKDLAGTSSHFFLDALDPDTYDRTQHLPDNYFNKLMDKANAKAVEILKNKGVAEGVELKFHTIELTESQIQPYVKKYFECYNIEKPYTKFVSNIKKLGSNKLIESGESQEITPFIQMINSVDSNKTIKVGDYFAVLAFEIVFAWKEINAYGFTTPKEVADIKMHSDGTINYIKFSDGDRYPRLTPATYQGKPIIQTAYFDNQNDAKSALTALVLKVPNSWEFNTSDVEQGVAEEENIWANKDPAELGQSDAWYGRAPKPDYYGYAMGTPERVSYLKAYNSSEHGEKDYGTSRGRPHHKFEDSNMPVAVDSTSPVGGKVTESYWTKLQSERSTKLNSLLNELTESLKK